MGYDYYGYDYGSYDSGVGSIVAGALLVPIIIGLLMGAYSIFVMWKIFVKAGKPGWIALIPFYNMYTLFEITWGNGWIFLSMFAVIIPVLGYIAFFVILFLTMIKLSKAFGKSDGFAVGLIFLSIIFMSIIAFDDSTYLGVPKKENNTTQPQNNGYNNYNNYNQPQNNDFMNDQNTQPTNLGSTFCSNCGTQLSQDTTFCPNCGTPKSN